MTRKTDLKIVPCGIMMLTRPKNKMPSYVRTALVKDKLMDAYRARPPYQQNDYIGWITRAKLEATRQRRLAQMLEELAQGNRYMKMAYRAKLPESLKKG